MGRTHSCTRSSSVGIGRGCMKPPSSSPATHGATYGQDDYPPSVYTSTRFGACAYSKPRSQGSRCRVALAGAGSVKHPAPKLSPGSQVAAPQNVITSGRANTARAQKYGRARKRVQLLYMSLAAKLYTD